MSKHTSWSPRALMALAVLMPTGAALAQGGFDRPLSGREAARSEDDGGRAMTESTVTIEDGSGSYTVRARNNEITQVQVDGKALADNRWRHVNGVVEILNDNGEVIKSIPFDTAKDAPSVRRGMRRLETLRNEVGRGRVLEPAIAQAQPKVMLGITFSESDDEPDAVRVDSVVEELPAAKAGLREGDRITKLGDKAVRGSGSFRELLAKFNAGDKVDLTILRDGVSRVVTVELEAYDAEKLSPATSFYFGEGWPDGPAQGRAQEWLQAIPFGFGGEHDESVREALESAQMGLNQALKSVREMKDGDLAKTRAEAQEQLQTALDEITQLRDDLSTKRSMWTRGPNGDVLVLPRNVPVPPVTPALPESPTRVRSMDRGLTADQAERLMERLERMEQRLKEMEEKTPR